MYVPKINKVEDRAVIADYIRNNNFGILVTTKEGNPLATHLPMELFVEGENWVIKGHMAKANEQWRSFTEQDKQLIIFSDAHTYISPSWYNHLNVPTWNYIAIHLYGKIELMAPNSLHDFITYQLNTYEAASENPVKVADFSLENFAARLKGVIGFEFQVNEIQARFKLSQNRRTEDF